MTKYIQFKNIMRQKANQFFYDDLKKKLLDYPSEPFIQYVLEFVEPFMQHGSIYMDTSNSTYKLHLEDANYIGYVSITKEDSQKGVKISISTPQKNATQQVKRGIIFAEDKITMTETSYYKSAHLLSEKLTISIFKNNENELVYRNSNTIEKLKGQKREIIETLRIKKDGDALIGAWNSEKNADLYFKASHVFSTFEDALKGAKLKLKEEEETSLEDANNFVKEWLKENSLTEAEMIMKYTPTID